MSEPEKVTAFRSEFQRIREELNRVFVGHDDLVTDLLAAVAADGHVLLEGVPGLGKTLLARTLAGTLALKFARIQFTPDLMPADITGALQLQEDEKGVPHLSFRPGPLMTNFLLADEINRATPRTQSALLEAMQEHQITAGEKTFALPEPFTVIATQNPIEQEGTYPLPEAELDRFLIKLDLGYPDEASYSRILDLTTGTESPQVGAVCSGEEIHSMRKTLREVLAEESVKQYAVRLVMGSQPDSPFCPAACREHLLRGAGPRAAQGLLLMGKAYALLDGRTAVGCRDIARAYLPVMRHRIALTFDAQMAGETPDRILKRLLETVKK